MTDVYENMVAHFTKEFAAEIELCGSRVTCSPPPTDTDRDYLVLVDPQMCAGMCNALDGMGFDCESEHYTDDGSDISFMSWRKEDVNFIMTTKPDFATKHRAATHVCKRLNLLVKADRIMVFQAVLYGKQHGSK